MTLPSLPVAVGAAAAMPRRRRHQLVLLLCSVLIALVATPLVAVTARALEIDRERRCQARATTCRRDCQASQLWPQDVCLIKQGCRGRRTTLAIAPWANPLRVEPAIACIDRCVDDVCDDVDVELGWPEAGSFDCLGS